MKSTINQYSIIIPVFNEEYWIKRLLDSISRIQYPQDMYEVIVVNDASTDQTKSVLVQYANVRLVDLIKNVGRYEARKIGYENAKYNNLLFVDARSEVDENILNALNNIDAGAVIGHCLMSNSPTIFEIFYLAIQRKIFRRYYQEYTQPIILNTKSFDMYPKGTTLLGVNKALLCRVYRDLEGDVFSKDSSDDTRLLRRVVEYTDIMISPDVKSINYGRRGFVSSIKHLFNRGPKFVDYYFTPKQLNFWRVIVGPPTVVLLFLFVSLFIKLAPVEVILLVSFVWFIIAFWLSELHVVNFVKIVMMLPVITVTFYLGIVKGVYIYVKRRLGGAVKTD